MPDLKAAQATTEGTRSAERRPLVGTPLFELYNRPRRKAEYLVDRLVPAGSKFLLSGTRGVWKSWTLAHLTVAVAAVEPFLGKFAVAPRETAVGGSVVYVSLEENVDETQRKLVWTVAGMGLDRDPRRVQDMLVEYYVAQPFTLDEPGRLDDMKAVVDAMKPDLVVWDSLRRMMRGDSNTDEFAQRLVSLLDQLQAVYPSAHGVVAHNRKKSSDKDLNDPGQMVRGSSALVDQVDVHLAIDRNRVEDYATVTHDKNRMGREYPPFNFRMRISDASGVACPEWIGTVAGDAGDVGEPKQGSAVASLSAMLSADPARTWPQSELCRALAESFDRDQVRYAVDVLERSRKALVDRRGKGHSPLVKWRLPMEEVGIGKSWENEIPNDGKPYKE